MKFLVLCLSFLSVLPLFAGKRIQMQSTNLTTKAVEPQETLLDSTRLRVNTAATSVMFLTDGGRNRMVMLDKAKNQYTEIDQAAIDQMGQALQGVNTQMEAALKGLSPEQRAQMEQMMKQMLKGKMPPGAAAAPTAATTYAAKGRGSVNGFACTNYEGTSAGQKVAELCAAQPSDLRFAGADYQVFQRMQQFAAGIKQALQNSPIAAMANLDTVQSGPDGMFSVQRTTFENGQAVKREELKSVADATFTDADFSLGDAKKVELPSIGDAGAGRGKGDVKGKAKSR